MHIFFKRVHDVDVYVSNLPTTLSLSLLDVWITRTEAVRGVPEEVQKQLEKLKVGHILCQPASLPPPLTDLLYTPTY